MLLTTIGYQYCTKFMPSHNIVVSVKNYFLHKYITPVIVIDYVGYQVDASTIYHVIQLSIKLTLCLNYVLP